jgi:micrococcal nuclease
MARRAYVQSRLRRRRRRRAGLLTLVILIAITALLDRLGVFGYTGNDWEAFDQNPFIVVRVIDGDTVDIAAHALAEPTRVRLLGIDAPETNARSSDPPEHWAAPSTDYLRARTGGQTIIIRLDQTQTRDRYGRLLAYLYLGEENLNLSIVRDGHAYADRRFMHSFRPQFEQAENEARRRGSGLWKDVTEDQMPPWRQRWLQEQSSLVPHNLPLPASFRYIAA